MLKIYEYNGLTFQFEEGQQPAGAVEVKPAEAPTKPAEAPEKQAETETKNRKPPANKARTVKGK